MKGIEKAAKGGSNSDTKQTKNYCKGVDERILGVDIITNANNIDPIIVTLVEKTKKQKRRIQIRHFKKLQEEKDEAKGLLIIMKDFHGWVGNENEGIEIMLGKKGKRVRGLAGDHGRFHTEDGE